jgi:hypothetical protein
VLGLSALLGNGVPSAAADEPCPNQEFRQGAGASLPDCRAYEQVTPVDKNGYDALGYQPPYIATFRDPAFPVSESGDAAIFRSQGSFAGNPTGGPGTGANFYFARRGLDDWSTVPGAPRGTLPGGGNEFLGTATDLSLSWLGPVQGAFEPEPTPAEEVHPRYAHQNFTGQTSLLFTDGSTPEGTSIAGSADFTHVVFQSGAVLVNDPAIPAFGKKVYEYADGQIRLVSRQPGNNEPFATEASPAGLAAGPVLFGFITGVSAAGAGAISSDGRQIYFETPAPTGLPGLDANTQLIYRRSDGAATELASPSRRTPVDPEGPKPKRFMRATPDGNRVFFTSPELLTDDANTGTERKGADLYRYDFEADELIDVSATPGGDGARVEGVLGVSADGDRVYYAALGQVVPGEGSDGQRNLYLWEDDGSADGNTSFIATLAEGEGTGFNDGYNWATGGSFGGVHGTSRVTPDGRFLLLGSRASLTGYDNHPINPADCEESATPAPCSEIFRYDSEANGGSGEMVCVSCGASDVPPTGPSEIPTGTSNTFPRAMSDDGRFVFFNTPDALVPDDTNERVDAYEWEGGEVHLLSTGKSTSNSQFVEATPDGTKAFIATRSPLVPQDTDHNVDIYAASVGGGLVRQQAVQLPSCEGEACRAAGTPPPPPADPVSASFNGEGNAPSKTGACAKGKRKVKGRCVKKQKRHAHKRQHKASHKRGGSK